MKENGGGGVTRAGVAVVVDDTERAFDALLRAQRRPLRRIAKTLSQGVDADDVEQELLLRAWRHREKLVQLDQEDLCRWSWAHGGYAAGDVRRKSLVADLLPQVPEDAAFAPDVFDLAADRDAVERLLSVLNSRSRSIVRARVLAGLTFAEIADHFGMSEENARKLYNRACARVRAHEIGQRGMAILLLPLRALLPSRKARVFGFPWAPAALGSVMFPLIVFRTVDPFGHGVTHAPAAPNRGAAYVQPILVAEPVTPTAKKVTHAQKGQTPASGPAPRRNNRPRPDAVTLPKAKAKGCVNNTCISTGPSDDPGDDVYVELPEPVGRKNVKQNAVPTCDFVPTVGPVGCERHT